MLLFYYFEIIIFSDFHIDGQPVIVICKGFFNFKAPFETNATFRPPCTLASPNLCMWSYNIILDVRSLAIASRASQFPSGALSCRADSGCLTGVPVASDNMLIS